MIYLAIPVLAILVLAVLLVIKTAMLYRMLRHAGYHPVLLLRF